jgi:prolyl oligopeptidase
VFVAKTPLAVPKPPRAASVPPVATRRDDVVENIFGHTVVDPYRWLEHGETDEVGRWTEQQNARTRRILDALPGYGQVHAELAKLLAIGTVGIPCVREVATGRLRYFHTRREGGQNQPALYVRDGVGGPDRALVDPNQIAPDGTTALDWWSPSSDGQLLAYGLSEGGDEESTLYVRDVATGEDLADVIERTRAASIGWLADGSGFFYTRYPVTGSVPDGEEKYHRSVFLHRMGTDPHRDPKVFEGRKLTDSPGVEVSPGGRWLVVSSHESWAKNELFLRDLRAPEAALVSITDGADGIFDPFVLDDVVFVRTNDGAPRFRLFAVDPEGPERSAWREVIGESADVLDAVTVVGSEIIAKYLSDASSRIRRFSRTGSPIAEVSLPTLGSCTGVSGLCNGSEAFYDFSSFAVAPTVYRIDLATGLSEKWEGVEAPMIDPDRYEVERLRATSKDGTPIPMFVVRKKGLPKTGAAPTLVTGYGGFNISIVPSFSRASYLWLDRGGILAVTNLRGGGELGEQWHRAGMLENKQNVFDDAIACAEHLVTRGYTDPDHLAVMGGSNGGLLVGALVTQRPDLFRAAICAVPLLDMLRYHRFRIAKLWISEYGSPDDREQAEWLWAYSPYHHVREGTAYPAVLFTTAESDSRVDPLHARKMAAAMQAATSSDRPILLRVETKAGHGAGKPVNKMVHELSDVYAFLLWQLGESA